MPQFCYYAVLCPRASPTLQTLLNSQISRLRGSLSTRWETERVVFCIWSMHLERILLALGMEFDLHLEWNGPRQLFPDCFNAEISIL